MTDAIASDGTSDVADSSSARSLRLRGQADKTFKLFGITWHYGRGSKDRMKAVAAAERSGALVQLQEPDHGYRNYGCYATWPDAIRRLRGIDVQRRHLYELIPHGHECKPYLDLDGPPLPRRSGASTSAHAELHTVEDVVERASELVTALFRSDYGVELLPEHLVWLDSPQEDKLSLHLTISTHGPQYVYSSNHRTDPSGAWHLASRLRQLDPSGIGAMVDVSVYSKDREMRTLGGVKHVSTQTPPALRYASASVFTAADSPPDVHQ